MNDFTKGEWIPTHYPNNEIMQDGYGVTIRGSFHLLGYGNEYKANAHLIATAGTAATKLAEAGYDAAKVLELIPDLLHLINELEGLEKIKGQYIRTWPNGTEEYSPSLYNHEIVNKLNLQAFKQRNDELAATVGRLREAYRAGFLSGCNYGAVNLRKTWESAATQYANKKYPSIKDSE